MGTATRGARSTTTTGAAPSSTRATSRASTRTTSCSGRAFSASVSARGTRSWAKGRTRARRSASTPAASGSTRFLISVCAAMRGFISPRRSTTWASSAAIFPAARAWPSRHGRRACSAPSKRTACGSNGATSRQWRNFSTWRRVARAGSAIFSPRGQSRPPRRSAATRRSGRCTPKAARRRCTRGGRSWAGRWEWRPKRGEMLRELVASGGMKPQGGGSAKPPPDLRDKEKWGPLDDNAPDGWARSHMLSEQYRQFTGIFGGCWFALTHHKPDGLNCVVDALNAVTGWNFTMDDALAAGHRSVLLQSIFATQRGWIADDDWKNVGPRFLKPTPDGKYQGFTIAKWLPDLIFEYYRLSGRHERSGRPFRDTLQRLGLEEFNEWAQGGE